MSNGAPNSFTSTGVLVDSNLLLLFFLGTYRRSLIGSHKRISEFTAQDFDLLVAFLARFKAVVTTPMILAEVNSLSNALQSKFRPDFLEVFAVLARTLTEERPATAEILATESFRKFGYTDAATHLAASQHYLVLTDDFPLFGFLEKHGIVALNFNHLRTGLYV